MLFFLLCLLQNEGKTAIYIPNKYIKINNIRSNHKKWSYNFTMNIKKTFGGAIFILSVLLFTTQNTFALVHGDTAPEIQVAKWFKNKPVEYLKAKKDGKNKDIVVLCIWATWSDTTNNLFRFLNTESDVFENDNVTFIALSKENQRIIDRYVRTDGKIKFCVAADDHSKTYDEYMVDTDGVPMFFIIGKTGNLIWKGSPFEVDRVLSRVVTNTYDNKQEIKIEKIREDLQKSIQFMNFERQNEIAEKILNIDPLDQTAINIVANNYIRKDQINQGIDFMLKRIDMSNYNKYVTRSLYFNLLTILQGMNNKDGEKYLLDTTKRFHAAFKNEPKALNAYCIALIQSMPMEIVPLQEAYGMINDAINLEKKLHPEKKENLGLYYRSLAKIYYMSSDIDKAIDAQKTSVKLLEEAGHEGNASLISQGALLLRHYSKIQKLQDTLK
jgi:hypothetical protein